MLNTYYEIEKAGQKYFGNVTLKEFHSFRQDGEFYLFNVAAMMPYRISEPVARLLEKMTSFFGGGLISGQAMEELIKLDLVAGNERRPDPSLSKPGAKAAEDEATTHYAVGNVALFIAQECNMACVYCYGQGGEYTDKSMMSSATAFKAVDWLMENSGDIESVNISFFGGEPLLNFPLIEKVVSYARLAAGKRGKKITFALTTNASLLTDRRIAFLQKENISPIISFDGSAEIQDRQRPFTNGKASYGKVYANIQKLRKVFPDLMARATLHGDADPADARAGLERAGFRIFAIAKASPVILDGHGVGGEASPEQKRGDERMQSMEKSMARDLMRAIRARNVGVEVMNGKVGFYIGHLILSGKRHYYCGVGRGMAAITTSGDIYPCHRFAGQKDMKLGTIDSYKPDGINDYHRAVVDNLPECRHCWARHACGGGCFYESKAARGDVRLPDRAFCRETKALIEMAISLYLQLDDEDKTYVKDYLRRRDEEPIS